MEAGYFKTLLFQMDKEMALIIIYNASCPWDLFSRKPKKMDVRI